MLLCVPFSSRLLRFATATLLAAGATSVQAQAPNWSVTPSSYEFNMGVTARVAIGGTVADAPSDRVAAFIDGEVRGVAEPTAGVSPSGEALFFITTYGNEAGKEVRFRVYDASADAVLDLDQTTSFEANSVRGGPQDPFRLSTGTGEVPGVDDWNVNPTGFEMTMNVTGALFVGGARSADAGDKMAAFINDEVRGVATPSDVNGKSLFFMTIYANADGETVTFRAYDASADAVYETGETLSFSANDVRGSPAEPFAWNTSGVSQAPVVPVLMAPADETQLDGVEPVLRWKTAPRATSYHLQTSTSPDFATSMLYTELPDTSHAPQGLDDLTQYYWRVRAVNAEGESAWSAPFSFTTTTGTAVEEARKGLPEAYTLRSNYPNPVTQTAIISFGLPQAASVHLRVVDASGREVAELVNGGQLSPGWHQARWNTEGVASGVYFYQIRAGDFVESRKMVVVR